MSEKFTGEILALKEGDEKAFVAIYKRFFIKLYGYTISLIKSNELAEDIVQEVFLKVWTNRKSIDTSKSFKAYLYTITQNQTFNVLKKIVHDKKLCQELYLTQKQSICNTDKSLLESEMAQIEKKILETLPPKRRRIFVMSRMEGKSYQEISNELGLSKQTVKNQISHSLKIITSYLETEGLPLVVYLTLSNL